MENAPPVGTFLGNSAEWIVERPTFCTAFVGDQCIGPILPDLSNYGTAVMFNAYAGLAGVGKFGLLAPYSNLPIFADSMFNDPNLLSSVKSTGKSSMQFTWSAFH